MTPGILGFVSEVAETVASHLPSKLASVELPTLSATSPEERLQRHVPKRLDLHYITERIIGMGQPAEAASPTRIDKGRDVIIERKRSVEPDENDVSPTDTSTANGPISPEEESAPQSPSSHVQIIELPPRIAKKAGNSPATLSSFLSRRHPKHFLVVNASDQEADDRTLLLLNRQIIRFHWSSPCIEKSETPSLSQMFDVCYAIHAYLSLDEKNVMLVYCSNGRTRTAIIVACYLKFSRVVKDALDGFRLFCQRRCPDLDATSISDHIPPSLKVFFNNFNSCVELGGYMNPKPLLLRAIALQGVPVDDKPCIDIWDSQQQHVYSSHQDLWLDDDEQSAQQQKISTSQWADEEGFYRVNKILAGDFVLICRFGGLHADDSDDPSKMLFRYANSSGFLCMGPYEFPKRRVDMMRRYDASFDEEDFLLTFMFDSSLDDAAAEEFPELCQPCSESVLPCILEGPDAIKRGFQIIGERHAARPLTSDVELLVSEEAALASLALQLTNHDVAGAQELLSGKLLQPELRRVGEEARVESEEAGPDRTSTTRKSSFGVTGVPELTSEKACANILGILDEIDVGGEMEWIDRVDGDLVDNWKRQPVNDDGTSQRNELSAELPVALYDPPMMPNRGDLVDAFGSYNVFVHPTAQDRNHADWRQTSEWGSRPRLPMHRGRKRRRTTSAENRRSAKKSHVAEHTLMDDDASSAMEFLIDLPHTGVTLQHLLTLQDASQRWIPEKMEASESQPLNKDASEASKQPVPTDSVETERIRNEPADSNIKAECRDGQTVPKDTKSESGAKSESQAEKKMMPGKNLETQDKQADGDSKAISSTPKDDKDTKESTGDKSPESEKENIPQGKDDKKKGGEVPLREDPEYVKFFRMLQVGLPMGAVRNALQRAGKDPDVMDLDPNKSLKSQLGSGEDEKRGDKDDGPPLKDDPEYSKYFKMMKVGMPKEVAAHAMQRDQKDPGILDLDPERSLKSQQTGGGDKKSGDEDDGPPLKDDPEYSKYFKMMKVGMPKEVAAHAMQRDQKDPGILDLDPEKSLKSQQSSGGDKKEDDGPPLKDDPEFSKYFKMMKVGMPKEVAAHAMQRDGKDPGILDLDPEKSLKSQQGSEGEDDGPPLRDDPEYAKYFKMLSMGLPVGACKNALQRDGKDPGIMDLNPDKSLKSQMDDNGEDDRGPALKDDPEFEKYFKMLKMLLPIGAVKQALQRDGKDPSILDLDHNKSLKSQIKKEDADDGPPLKDDPEYAKYFKMLKMGLPKGAVKNAMQRDGKDGSILDLDYNRSVASQQNSGKRRKLSKKEKKSVRRKKIYWTPIDPVKVRQDSLWSLVQGTIEMAQLNYDTKEFENLFTESSNPAERKKKSRSAAGDKSEKQKKTVQIIDGKRGMNGGIILARLKIDYHELAKMVDNMESKNLDSTQLSALKEFLPTDEERMALQSYLKKSEGSDDAKAKAMAAISECEKYMCAMLNVRNANEKFDCMLFKAQFDSRLDELKSGRDTIKKACDEVRSSERIRKMMAMILTLVNQINTGGSGNMAVGFSLDALLKLNEAKAFDKKTSVLHYLAKLVLQNDKTLITFHEDIPSVGPAENIILDSLSSDIGTLSKELDKVHQTAMEEASSTGGQNSSGEIEEAAGGRTPMEIFTLRAKKEVQEAVASIDELKKSYGQLLEYFGEDEQLASNDFFGTIQKFVAAFTAAAEQVEQAEKKKQKEKQRADAKAAALSTGVAKPTTKNLLKRQNGERMITSTKAGNKVLEVIADTPGASRMGMKQKTPLDAVGKGIAAAAAAAAALRSKENGYEMEKGGRGRNTTCEIPPGKAGIAAVAAAAAGARKRGQLSKMPPGRAGIAAVAAAAGAMKSNQKPDMSQGIAGIAAAAAAAAGARKKVEMASGKMGIGAAAAAGAKKEGQLSEMPSERAGIAAAAAAAGARKGDEKSEMPSGRGGIAAAAAAAALLRSNSPKQTPLAMAARPSGVDRKSSSDDEGDSFPPTNSPPLSPAVKDGSVSPPPPPPPASKDGGVSPPPPPPISFDGGVSPPPPPPPAPLPHVGPEIEIKSRMPLSEKESSLPPPLPKPSAGHDDGIISLASSRSDESYSPPPPPPSSSIDSDDSSSPPPPPPSTGRSDPSASGDGNYGLPLSPPQLPGIRNSEPSPSESKQPVSEDLPATDALGKIDPKQTAAASSRDEPFKSIFRPAALSSSLASSLTEDWLADKQSSKDLTTSAQNEAASMAMEALAVSEGSQQKSAKDVALQAAAARKDEAASLAMEALSRCDDRQDSAKDVAGLAAAARQSEAASLAASAASTRAERITQSAKEIAALAATARQSEAVSLASAALERSGSVEESSKNAAAAAATTRKNEAAAAIAAALDVSRREREVSKENRTATKPSRQSEAAAAIAAAFAASKRVGSTKEESSARTDKVNDVEASLAAARATLGLRREDADASGTSPLLSSLSPESASSRLDRLLLEKSGQRADGTSSSRRHPGAGNSGAAPLSSSSSTGHARPSIDDLVDTSRRSWSNDSTPSISETMTDDLAELLKARMAIRSAKKTIYKSKENALASPEARPLKPSDVKASLEGTGSRVDANALLWDTEATGINNDLSAILWDNDVKEEGGDEESEQTKEKDNAVKQWFRGVMGDSNS